MKQFTFDPETRTFADSDKFIYHGAIIQYLDRGFRIVFETSSQRKDLLKKILNDKIEILKKSKVGAKYKTFIVGEPIKMP